MIKNKKSTNHITNTFTYALIGLSILVVYQEIIARSNFVSVGINTVYWVELGLPVAYLTENKKKRYSLIGLIGIAVFVSLKSTAMIAFVIPILFVILINGYKKNGHLSKGLFVIIVLCLLIYVIIPDFEQMLQKEFGLSWITKINNSLESGGSGRTEIWKTVISYQSDSTIGQWLFGHGYGGVITYTGRLSAHNDCFEVLFDYGLVAFIPYIYAFFCLIKSTMVMIRKKSRVGIAMGISLVQFTIISLFSHLIIYPWLLLTPSIIWAACFAENYNSKNNSFVKANGVKCE
ncbi:MAG: O-antigen ligase family protein [Eubacteriales bacterium]|nr:O-antigen ligase family protein [Eubacteriales bacterium]